MLQDSSHLGQITSFPPRGGPKPTFTRREACECYTNFERRSLWCSATRIGRAVAVLGGLLLLAGPAGADLTFQVDIKGEIYTDDGPVVKVTCKGKDGTTATFPNADVDVESLLAFTFPTSCGLHSAAGVFGDGERFNGQVVDDEATAVIATKKGRRGEPACLRHLEDHERQRRGVHDARVRLDLREGQGQRRDRSAAAEGEGQR